MLTSSNHGQGGGDPSAGGAKVQGFSAGYLSVPTSANPGVGQTLAFGQLGVLGSPSPTLQQQQQQSTNKQDQVQKVRNESNCR